jgi:hypothetical protein
VAHLIEVAFKGNRREFFLWEGEAPPPLQSPVIVEADRGEDLGHVHAIGELAASARRAARMAWAGPRRRRRPSAWPAATSGSASTALRADDRGPPRGR